MTLKYLSVCSGIEAATVAWHSLGWKPEAFSEIEKFPSAVLAHHYPNVPNLGDMTKFKEWNLGTIDLLVGGTPCQSFSVAGLRKGLDDPRGNLMLTYLAIAEQFAPKWLVWENVPGVLSSNKGKDFTAFLDALEEIGYIIDVDILDAQFHGLPQRRRRVFVCGQHRDDLLNQMTDSSALTIAQCLQEILQSILIEESSKLGSERVSSDLAYLSKDGVTRRMRLFGMLGEQNSFKTLQNNLIEAFRRYQAELNILDVSHGEKEKERIQEDQLMDSQMESLFTLTEQSLNQVLEESYDAMKSFITLTETNQITQSQIFTCSRAALIIAKLIQLLNQSSPSFWSAASSSLTSLQEYTNYARQTSSDIFGDMDRVQAWCNFIRQAESTISVIGNIGIGNFGKIFPVTDSMQGNTAPSREAGENVAASTGPCVASGKQTIGTLMANAGTKLWLGNQEALTGDYHILQPTSYGIQSNIIGRQDHNGGNGVGISEGIAPTLTKADQHGVAVVHGTQDPCVSNIAFALGRNNGGENALINKAQVRRLTPVECARLQGFPDNYMDINYRGKPAADGPKYKALGNSMAVPVMHWIGQRIQMVEGLC